MLHKYLENFGLSKKEVQVYLSLLSIGQATATHLAEKTQIPRASIHQVCKSLQKKGLCNALEKEYYLLFFPAPPETLLQLIEINEKKLQKKKMLTKQVIQKLKKPQALSRRRH